MNDAISIRLKPESVRRSKLSRILLSGLLLLALWFVLCRQLSGEWSDNEQYSYGWFVPFFALFLFWLRWDDRGESRKEEGGRRKRGIAIAIAIGALLLLLPIRLFEIANPDWRPLGWVHTGVVVTMTLLVLWLAGGKPWVRHFAFPVAFFFVAVPWVSPIEQPIVQGLMRIVAAVASETITLFGIPAQLEGNLIRVSTGLVGVNEACSGVRSLQTSIMIGLLFGELKRLSVTRRILLVLGALAIAIIANFARAFFLVWIAATQSISAVDRWHDFAGYTIVAAVFCGSLLLAALLEKGGRRKAEGGNGGRRAEGRSQKSEPTSDLRPHFLLHPSSFILCLLWLVAVEAGAHEWYRAHEKNLTARGNWSVRPPEKAPGFREIKIDESVRQTLRFDLGREVTWRTIADAAPGFSTTNYLFFFRWNPGSASVLRARAHRPDICLPSIGWQQLADRGAKTYLARENIPIVARHITFRQGNGNAVAHTFFCLQEDKTHADEPRPDLQLAEGVQPDWSMKARFRTVRNGIRNLGQQVLEVIFVSSQPMDDQMAEDKFAELLRETVEPEVGGQKAEVRKRED